MKHFSVNKKQLSNKLFSRVRQHGTYDVSTGEYIISAPLIAQLGKNFDKGNDTLISGSEIRLIGYEIYSVKLAENFFTWNVKRKKS